MPLPPAEDRALRAVGARRRSPGAPTKDSLVRTLRALAQESPSLVAVFDARAVAGERHLLSAWAHLGRARSRGESRLRDRSAELALYLAGDDQLPRALEKVGISEGTEQFVLVTERPLEPRDLLARFDLEEDATAYPRAVDEVTLDRLGVTVPERSAVPPERWEALVLERVALLELSAPAGRPTPEKK